MENNIKASCLYYILFCTGIVYFSYIILFDYPAIQPIWDSFADSKDYKLQSEQPLFSPDFFAPGTSLSFAPRPFTIPLFYKLASSDPFKMVVLQKVVYCICTLTLTLIFISLLGKKWLKLILLYVLLYFFTWWNIVGWTSNILSESLSMSLMFLWFATILIFYKCQSALNLLLLMIVSILLSFTRDTWPYCILLFFGLNCFIAIIFKKISIKKSFALFAFSIVLFFIQNYTGAVGERYKLPVFNSIVGRVAQSDEYLNWFKNKGMPLTDQIKKDFKGIDVDEEQNRDIIYKKYYDKAYAPVFKWIVSDGKSAYQEFLFVHPSYLFLKDQTPEQIDRIFGSNLSGFTGKPQGFYLNASGTFPFFSLISTTIFLILLSILGYRRKSETLLLPLVLTMLFFINALISYNADALEVKRHLFVTQIVLEFINLISLALIIDCVINYSGSSEKSLKATKELNRNGELNTQTTNAPNHDLYW